MKAAPALVPALVPREALGAANSRLELARSLAFAGGPALAGALVGLLIYAGLTRIPTRHVFSVTNLFIALLAGSLASQLARALAQAGFIEAGSSPLWDSSALLSQDSALGTLLHALEVGAHDRKRLLFAVLTCAQPAHRDLDDVGVGVEIHVPHLRGDQ